MYQSVMELVVFSEGDVSYSELWHMSFTEREMLVKTINKYNAKKSGDSQQEML